LSETISTDNYLKDIESFLKLKTSICQLIPNQLESIIGDEKYLMYNGYKIKTAYLVDCMHSLIMKHNQSNKLNYNLSSLVLRKKYGDHYSFYIKWLINNEFLSLKSNYYVGKKTKTFRINSKVIIECNKYINTDKTLLKKYKNNVLSLNTNKTNYNWIEKEVRQKIVNDLFYIDIDMDKVKKILSTLDEKSFMKNEYSVDCINKKHIFFHFDKYGRVHTNFTTLKSDIRKGCLLIDGEEIEEVDIRNSQPLFLSILIDKYIGTKMGCVDDKEFEFFKYLVINGKFYKYYMSKTGIETKKEAKTTIYKVLFGRNLDDHENNIFKGLFPTIHNFIIIYKEYYENYKSLAYELQRSESNFLFNSVIKEIMNKYPNIKLFTVHDSISYAKKYSKEVNDIFNRNINLLFK